MNQTNEIELYGKKYRGSLNWLNDNTMVLEFNFKNQDLEDLLDLDEDQVISIKVDDMDKMVKVQEPTLSKDENGNHAMIQCILVD